MDGRLWDTYGLCTGPYKTCFSKVWDLYGFWLVENQVLTDTFWDSHGLLRVNMGFVRVFLDFGSPKSTKIQKKQHKRGVLYPESVKIFGSPSKNIEIQFFSTILNLKTNPPSLLSKELVTTFVIYCEFAPCFKVNCAEQKEPSQEESRGSSYHPANELEDPAPSHTGCS